MNITISIPNYKQILKILVFVLMFGAAIVAIHDISTIKTHTSIQAQSWEQDSTLWKGW